MYLQVLLCSGQDRPLPAPHPVRSVSQVAAFLRFQHACSLWVKAPERNSITLHGFVEFVVKTIFFISPKFFLLQFFVNVSWSTLKICVTGLLIDLYNFFSWLLFFNFFRCYHQWHGILTLLWYEIIGLRRRLFARSSLFHPRWLHYGNSLILTQCTLKVLVHILNTVPFNLSKKSY